MVRRGFDPDAVLARLRELDHELERLSERERALEREVAAASRPRVEFGDLDAASMTALVGEEAAEVLRSARDEAALIRAKADDEAVQIVAAAYDEAARVRESVQEEVTYLQRVTAEQVETELASARGRGLEMVTEAREYRERVLADLAQRRDLARAQVRALIDGRDHLLRAFEVARLAAVDIIVELEQAAPMEDTSTSEQSMSNQFAESAIYDADLDLTPVAGIEIPATSGPVLVTSVGDDDTGELAVPGVEHVAPRVDDAFTRRSAVLAPLCESLAKQFKRVVVDEQNEVLTAIRRTERVASIDELLPGEDAHIERYHVCALAEIADAFAAGAAALGAGGVGDAMAMNASVLGRITEELVLPMRERLERVIESSQGNRFELSAFVRSAYREWKQRFDALAEELLLAAHSQGAYSSLQPGSLVVWQADPSGSPCPEVSANTGVVVRVPDAFPSGHVFPPASATCRCMIQRVPE